MPEYTELFLGVFEHWSMKANGASTQYLFAVRSSTTIPPECNDQPLQM